jgi:hypothetical protein
LEEPIQGVTVAAPKPSKWIATFVNMVEYSWLGFRIDIVTTAWYTVGNEVESE